MTRALQLEPGSSDVHFRYAGNYLLPQGRVQEGIAELQQALELGPLAVYPRFTLGCAFYIARDYGRADEQFRFLFEAAPDQHTELKRALDLAYLGLGMVRAAEGRFDEAIAAFRRTVELSEGGLPMRWGLLGSALARNGATEEARAILERLQALRVDGYCPATSLAWICFSLGDLDAGFRWLENAVDERDFAVVGIHT